MKIRDITFTFAVGAVAFATAISTSAQVIIRGTESSDKSASQSETTVSAPDRDVMTLIRETKASELDANTKRTESVTRARLPEGNYFESGRSVTIKKDLSPDKSVSSTDVTKKDPQGQDRVVGHTDETVSKSATGETTQSKVYTRNTKGELVLDRVVDANTVKGSDGAENTTRVEKTADVNGNLTLKKQVEEVAVDRSPNEKVVTSKTKTVDHLSGELAVTAEETSSITTQGGTKQTESVVRTPGRTGWEEKSRSTTTETTAPDGSVRRETIEQGRSIYSTKTGNQMLEPIVPQRKIVEQEVHKPDGTTVLQRDVFHRDVNGDWKPESFSTKGADKGISGQN
jgi:hypothetical protein